MRVSGLRRSQLLLKELEIPSRLSLLHNSFLEPALVRNDLAASEQISGKIFNSGRCGLSEQELYEQIRLKSRPLTHSHRFTPCCPRWHIY